MGNPRKRKKIRIMQLFKAAQEAAQVQAPKEVTELLEEIAVVKEELVVQEEVVQEEVKNTKKKKTV